MSTLMTQKTNVNKKKRIPHTEMNEKLDKESRKDEEKRCCGKDRRAIDTHVTQRLHN